MPILWNKGYVHTEDLTQRMCDRLGHLSALENLYQFTNAHFMSSIICHCVNRIIAKEHLSKMIYYRLGSDVLRNYFPIWLPTLQRITHVWTSLNSLYFTQELVPCFSNRHLKHSKLCYLLCFMRHNWANLIDLKPIFKIAKILVWNKSFVVRKHLTMLILKMTR